MKMQQTGPGGAVTRPLESGLVSMIPTVANPPDTALVDVFPSCCYFDITRPDIFTHFVLPLKNQCYLLIVLHGVPQIKYS
jgi:hypothetical protein